MPGAIFTAEGRCIARRVSIASTFRTRLVGLLRHRDLNADEGLLLVPGGSIHTFGMRFAIDVVFLDRNMRVLGLAADVPPRRVRFAPPCTATVLELSAGSIAAAGLLIGTQISRHS